MSFCLVQGKLIPAVFGHVFSELTTDITGLLEQQILSSDFNQVSEWLQCDRVVGTCDVASQLGGVQLDKDLRALTTYLSSHTSWPVRDKFSRLMQISTLLTLETVSLMCIASTYVD